MTNQTTNRTTLKKKIRKFFRPNRWSPLAKFELLALPENTLGFALGSFLVKHQRDTDPENNDALHVLTNTGISAAEEIGLQYYLLGNGQRNLHQFTLLLIGTAFHPMQWKYFLAQYRKGKTAHHFHYLDFSCMLTVSVSTIRQTFKIQ
jgi:ubiquinone biosynthesis protein Coq4